MARHGLAGAQAVAATKTASSRRCRGAALNRAVDLGEISARAAHQVVRVAWTLADLQDDARPGPQDIGQALAFQLGVAR